VSAGAAAAPDQQGSRSERFCSRRCFLSDASQHQQRSQHQQQGNAVSSLQAGGAPRHALLADSPRCWPITTAD
jgi:hypothetical protein